MQRHRGLFLGFALSALLGLMGNQAQAGLITVTITLSGATVEQVTSTSTTAFTVDTVALDSKLGALGSIYTFTNLAVTSSNPSALPAFLQTNAQVTEIAGTNTEAVVVTVAQSGFLAPTGPGGVLESSAAGNSSPSTGGSSSFVSSYNTTNATALVQSGTTSMGSNSTSIGTIPVTGYSLNNLHDRLHGHRTIARGHGHGVDQYFCYSRTGERRDVADRHAAAFGDRLRFDPSPSRRGLMLSFSSRFCLPKAKAGWQPNHGFGSGWPPTINSRRVPGVG